MEITLSDEMGKYLKDLSSALKMDIDDLVRRAFRQEKPNGTPPPGSPTSSKSATFKTRDCELPVGLRLRKLYKGTEYHARVESAGIRVDGIDQVFRSPSMAAVAVTGQNTNGWIFWEYCDDATNNWYGLDRLRSGG